MMRFWSRSVQVGLSIAICFAIYAPVSVGAELYRYKNEDGVTVLDSHVPARYVKNGYTILSLDGRVLEVVPRALSEEEIQEREAADRNLLRLYSTPSDVIRARDAKIASIDGLINTQRGNIQRLESQRRQEQSALAEIERAGGSLGKERLSRIRQIENRIDQIESEIRQKQEEKQELVVSYAQDLKRIKELYRKN